MDLFESGFEEKYLKLAMDINEKMIEIFYDEKNGGFFDVSGNDNSILIQTKEDYDSAEPAGNSIAIMNLLRLSQILKEDNYYLIAEKSLKYFSGNLSSNPHVSPQMLCALEFYLNSPKQIIIAGNKDDDVFNNMVEAVNSLFLPDKVLICCESKNPFKTIPYLNEIIKSPDLPDRQAGKTLVYICENFSCKLPVDNVEEFKKILS